MRSKRRTRERTRRCARPRRRSQVARWTSAPLQSPRARRAHSEMHSMRTRCMVRPLPRQLLRSLTARSTPRPADLLRHITDPEHPLTLEQLAVVSRAQVHVYDPAASVDALAAAPSPGTPPQGHVFVEFTPTIPHCSMATLIGTRRIASHSPPWLGGLCNGKCADLTRDARRPYPPRAPHALPACAIQGRHPDQGGHAPVRECRCAA